MVNAGNLSPAHILVIDDESDALAILHTSLTRCGYQVTLAESATIALDLLKEMSFDLVLCDLCLTEISGIEFTRTVSHMHPNLPIVVITGFCDVDAARESLRSGASDFITKPLEISRLPIILENNLQRKKIEAQKLLKHRAEVLFKAIKALAAAIDAKSHYTGCHSARMAGLCLEIGKEMGLNSERLKTLELAAHIHDVGKIGTPDAVLTKPGKLTDDEWADILKHPSMGADFLSGIDELAEVATIVRHHHEHVDGSGYPDGLKGNAIPPLARILAVADAFEAMTSNRPYRKAISYEEAVEELQVNAGTQFDVAVVSATANVIANIIYAREDKAA
ncbi:MAG: HD domain-containing phosphohydrolase [Armatimonadota bacterium]|nr:response regulator [bacterium]